VGATLLAQGDAPKYLYCILSGRVSTTRRSPQGGISTIRMLGSGDTFMDAAIFMDGESPVGVTVLQESRIFMVPHDVVRRIALQDCLFANNLIRIVTRHYKNAIHQIDSLLNRAPLNRVGYYFLKLYLQQKGKSLVIDLPFQKSTIANHLGMVPETFSRALQQIKKRGVRIGQHQVTLRDPYSLCEFCDGDTARKCPNFNTEKCAHGTSGKKNH